MLGRTIVLIIDSDPDARSRTSDLLSANAYDTAEAEDGLTGLRQFFSLHPDIVIVDLEISEMSGWTVIKRIRELSDTPIVVTASEATNEDVSRSLELDVDAFLAKPFDPQDLTGRLNAIQNKASESDEERWVYKRNGLTVDLRSCDVFVQGRPVQLTGTEYKLLTYLIDRRGWVLSHDQILSHVWGSDYAGDRNQVKLYVWYLRKKIENDPHKPEMIVTKRGLGYSFAA
ncbi:MAG TPA: response regulator transcription factor [Dehalococcoidia bacterium]